MGTTAEGVETAEQYDVLVAEGCTHAQGFHVSRPVPAASVAGLLVDHGSAAAERTRAAG